jgi:KDO2-lipid IV(A) lauroyltransferase
METLSPGSISLNPNSNGFKALIARAPQAWLLFLGKILGHLLYSLPTSRRRIVRRNLRFSRIESSPEGIKHRAKIIFQHFGITILELVQMTCMSKQQIISKVRIEGQEILSEALARQKGVVLVTAHLGNYEMAAQSIPCIFGIPLASVAKQMRNPWINRLIHNMRTRFGNRVIYKKGALPEMTQTLRQGRVVTILMDISRRFDGVEVEFFGHRATATPSAALLGLRCKSPIIPAFSHRNPSGELIVKIEPPIEIQRTDDLRYDLKTNTQLITDRIERAVRKYPDQWNWVLKRWKDYYPDLYPESKQRLRRIEKKEKRKRRGPASSD